MVVAVIHEVFFVQGPLAAHVLAVVHVVCRWAPSVRLPLGLCVADEVTVCVAVQVRVSAAVIEGPGLERVIESEVVPHLMDKRRAPIVRALEFSRVAGTPSIRGYRNKVRGTTDVVWIVGCGHARRSRLRVPGVWIRGGGGGGVKRTEVVDVSEVLLIIK